MPARRKRPVEGRVDVRDIEMERGRLGRRRRIGGQFADHHHRVANSDLAVHAAGAAASAVGFLGAEYARKEVDKSGSFEQGVDCGKDCSLPDAIVRIRLVEPRRENLQI